MPPTEIVPQLFIGTREDAEALGKRVPDGWTVISVTEYRSRYKRKEELPNEPVGSLDMPFMADWPGGWHADPHKLDLIAETIWWKIQAGDKVLVHCIHAQERAPLTAVWYLAWSGAASSIARAYETVTQLHPRTERRDIQGDKKDKSDNRQDWLRGASPRRPRPELSALLGAARVLSIADPHKRAAAQAALETAAVAWATRKSP